MSARIGPNIVTDGLVLYLDAGNTKSYPGSGTTWKDLITNKTYISSNYTWANDITEITICCIVEKLGVVEGFAEHPINKWNSSTVNTSFVLYHFGNTSGPNINRFSWYYTVNSTWVGQFGKIINVNQKTYLVFQFNSLKGAQVWADGIKVGTRGPTGILGINGTSVMNIHGPIGTAYSKVHYVSFYDRELSDSEILQNYNALKSRYI